MKVLKNGVEFFVDKKSKHAKWFNKWINELTGKSRWEPDTFKILTYFSDPDKLYIDIGAWVGPTVLYSNSLYKKVYAFEPDPVALVDLKLNIKANHNSNITVVEKAIADNDGEMKFGGNGALGNSESTLLVNDKCFLEKGGHRKSGKHIKSRRGSKTVKVGTIKFNTFLNQYKVDPRNIGLIKMDIEGGEKIVVEAMKDFFKKYKPNLYISLHWVFLQKNDIEEILKTLFSIYEYCYRCYHEEKWLQVNEEQILNKEIHTLVFTNTSIEGGY